MIPVPGTYFFLPVRAALVEQRLFDAQLLKYRHVLQSEHSQDTLHPMRDDDKQRKQVVASTHACIHWVGDLKVPKRLENQ